MRNGFKYGIADVSFWIVIIGDECLKEVSQSVWRAECKRLSDKYRK